jgi:hypothetical protein
VFKTYDRVNYGSKDIIGLKSQLQSQIFIFQTSRKVFAQENPYNVWQLPKTFDQADALNFLNKAQ